jgi:hypothetical protein
MIGEGATQVTSRTLVQADDPAANRAIVTGKRDLGLDGGS